MKLIRIVTLIVPIVCAQAASAEDLTKGKSIIFCAKASDHEVFSATTKINQNITKDEFTVPDPQLTGYITIKSPFKISDLNLIRLNAESHRACAIVTKL